MSVSRNTNRDHAKKTNRPLVEDEVVASQLEALLAPAITALENYYRQLGLRDRILNLPLMVAAGLTLRLIEVRAGKTWHSYLTSVLDPTILPPYVVADL